MSRFTGLVSVVTGAAGGIGASIAQRLADDGATVIVADLDYPGAQTVARTIADSGGDAHPWLLDVCDRAQVEAAVTRIGERFAPVDILVNNAGFANQVPLLDIAEAEWEKEFAVIVNGLLHCSRAVLPAMMARGSGVIINIGSVNGMAFYSHPTYSAAKAAAFSLTQSMAALYGGRGVRVNAIAPGTIRTPIWDFKVEADPAILDHLTPYIPLGRVGTPKHIADAVAFLASADAAHITGVILPVDGGLTTGILPMAHEISGAR